MNQSFHRVMSAAAAMSVAAVVAVIPDQSAFAQLETYGTQSAFLPGAPNAGTVPGMPVQYAGTESPVVTGGGSAPGCFGTASGDYYTASVDAGSYGGGAWYANTDASEWETYTAYGNYKSVMGELSWKDHPTKTDAVAAFLGPSWMVGGMMPNLTMRNMLGSAPGNHGIKLGVAIDFPGLGEIGEVVKNELAEFIAYFPLPGDGRSGPFGTRIPRDEIHFSDPDNVDLAKIDWPKIKLTGVLLGENNLKAGNSSKGVGGSAGRYRSGTIDMNCIYSHAATATLHLQSDVYYPWFQENVPFADRATGWYHDDYLPWFEDNVPVAGGVSEWYREDYVPWLENLSPW